MSSVEAWWARSRWWWEHWTSLRRQSGPKRWLAYDGDFDSEWSSSYLRTNETATWLLGHFVVPKHRTPSYGRYVSAPDVVFDSGISVSTDDPQGIWPFRDHPSAQVGYELSHSVNNGQFSQQKTDSRTFVDIRDNSWEYESGQFGSTSFPEIQFYLDPNYAIHIDLKVKITYFIVGDARINLGTSGKPFRMRLPQYDICSI